MTTPAETENEALGEDTVVFYWRPGCMFCWSLRRQLTAADVVLDERNIWDDPEAAAVVRSAANGNETVPTVVVAGQALVNPVPSEVLARLGRPSSELPPSGLRRLVLRLLGGAPKAE